MALITAVFVGAFPGSTTPCSPVLSVTLSLRIAKRYFAIEQGKGGAAIVCDGQVEFGATDGPGSDRRPELDFFGFLAAKEISCARLQIELRLLLAVSGVAEVRDWSGRPLAAY